MSEEHSYADDRPSHGDRAARVAAIALAVAAVGLTALSCARATDGMLVYALDDAYIHLALGRTLAESGILGVNAQTPAAASSSPAWTFLLAGATKLFGAATWLPLALGMVAAAALAAIADRWLRELRLAPLQRLGVIALIVIIGPLGPLAMTGMEHVAHAAAVLLLAWLALRATPCGPLLLALAAALAMSLRYESAFVAAGLALVLLLRRDWLRATALVAGPAVVVTAMGLWQLSMGEGFLPNSLAVKAAGSVTADPGSWLRWKVYGAMQHAFETPVTVLPLLALLVALAATIGRRPDDEAHPPSLLRIATDTAAALAVAMLLHIILARTGWYHRYEAYLLIWGVIAVTASAAAWRAQWAPLKLCEDLRPALMVGIATVTALLLLAFGPRVNAWLTAPEAAREIHLQHHQMARFVERYYPSAPLVLHDIGYIAYVSKGPLLDMAGLASREVAVAKSEGRLDQQLAERMAREHGARIGISYAHEWVPGAWERVASWQIGSTRVVGSDTVHFFAVSEDPERLEVFLREFEPLLPSGVAVSYRDRDDSALDGG